MPRDFVALGWRLTDALRPAVDPVVASPRAQGVKPLEARREGARMEDHAAFFREFLKHPLQIGSVVPSSHFLERRIVDAAGIRSAKTIVELGPGNGGTTRAILRAAAPEAKLLCIEVNPKFHSLVCRIGDDRLIAHLGGALSLRDALSLHGLDAPDVIVSGIPFSTMSNASGTHIIQTIASALASGGRFVAYQVSHRVAELCRPLLGPEQVEVELLNLPPMRVYVWSKNGGGGEGKASSALPNGSAEGLRTGK